MRWLKQWRSGPIATLIIAWIFCSGTTLTLFVVARVRSAERGIADMGFRSGGLAAVQINWVSALPGLAAYYAVVVLLPPTLLFLLWRRALRRGEDGV